MFPFSPLPLLLKGLILKELEPIDMFCFSLISKKSHFLAKRSKLVVNEVEWTVCEDNTTIHVIGTRNGQCFWWRILLCDPTYSEPEGPKFDAQINDTKFGVYVHTESASQWVHMVSSENAKVFAEVISNRLMDVLKPQQFSLWIEDCSIPPYILRYTRTFESVHAAFSETRLHDNDALTLLNEITADHLNLDYSAFTVPEEQPSLKHRCINLNVAPWFTKELLMKMECESLYVVKPNLTSEDLQTFFEAWKEGKYPKLSALQIHMKRGFQWNLNLAPVDDDGEQVINDVGGKIGELFIDDDSLIFLVSLE